MIYPDTVAEMEAGGWRDEDLAAVLDTVSLGHILTREGGWDAAADWKVTIVIVSGNYLQGESKKTGISKILNFV